MIRSRQDAHADIRAGQIEDDRAPQQFVGQKGIQLSHGASLSEGGPASPDVFGLRGFWTLCGKLTTALSVGPGILLTTGNS